MIINQGKVVVGLGQVSGRRYKAQLPVMRRLHYTLLLWLSEQQLHLLHAHVLFFLARNVNIKS